MPQVSTTTPALFRAGVLVCAALCAIAAPLHAQEVDASGDYLQRIDIDGDGRISLTEFQDWMGYAFARMDVDGDGVLSSAELPGGRGKPVSLAEHRDTLAQTFRRQDRNRDGYLDVAELSAPPQ